MSEFAGGDKMFLGVEMGRKESLYSEANITYS